MQVRSGSWQIKALISVVMLLPFVLSGCAGQVYVDSPSINKNSRVRYLVIHHTSKNFAESLSLLTSSVDNPVSAHYLVPESDDDTYPNKKLRVYRLVPESERAWHAGISYWNGEESLNDLSIGIELVNQTYCVPGPEESTTDAGSEQLCFYPDFGEDQLALLVELVAEILHRNPDIKPTDIVGHADIAPDRKVDPGPRFPWQRLYRLGYGAWYDDETVLHYWKDFRLSLPSVATIQQGLNDYGYQIELTGLEDNQTRDVMRAFQMHFRPSLNHGKIDAESAAVLFALLEKYRPERLKPLLNESLTKTESTETGE
jgi:N-acetylmuramoyl-L-alanine amidase